MVNNNDNLKNGLDLFQWTSLTVNADEKQTRLFLHKIEHLDGHNCTEKYNPSTLTFVRGSKEEIFSHQFERIDSY